MIILYNFIKNLILNVKYTNIIKKAYDNEHIIENLSSLFEAPFRKAWFGRIYVVLNPNIKNGKYDANSQVFEYGDNGLINDEYVKKWIFERLNIASQFIQANNLFDILVYDIKKIDDYDNYLFTMEPITFSDFKKWTKRFILLLSLLVVAGIVLLFIFK